MIAHGFPPGEGVAVGLESERRVREAGATPATIGVLDGEVRVGLDEQELERFGATARKLGPRDVAAAVAQRAVGATTVGGTLAVARTVGLRFMGTGGIGGVHRGWTQRPDISSDLGELARTRVVVVASGAKSILDVPATAEALETLGIPTLGFRTDTLPLFYAAEGGPPVSARVESPGEVAEIASAHWELGGAGLLVGNPPAQSLDDVEGLIEQALEEAGREGVGGQGLTPFVLSWLHRESGGRTLEANRALVADNAGLAAEVAVSPRAGVVRLTTRAPRAARRSSARGGALDLRRAPRAERSRSRAAAAAPLGDDGPGAPRDRSARSSASGRLDLRRARAPSATLTRATVARASTTHEPTHRASPTGGGPARRAPRRPCSPRGAGPGST